MNRLGSIRRFFREERGNVSVFMICLLPMFLGLAGLAIDAANAYRVRAQLQATADAAALGAAGDMTSLTNARAMAIAYAQKNLPVAENGNVLVNTDVTSGNWNADTRTYTENGTPLNAVKVTVRRSTANGNPVPTALLKIIGVDHWDIAASAVATTNAGEDQPKLWVALVLDNTGSMCEPHSQPCSTDTSEDIKINALKTASHQLLETLQNAANEDGDVEVAVIPFTRDVQVGTSSASASWLRWDDFTAAPSSTPSSSIGPGSSCPWSDYGQGFHCQSTPTNGSSTVNTIPSSGTYKGYICPSDTTTGHYYNGCFNSVCVSGACKTGGYGSSTYSHTWIPNATSTWGGCVTDRDQNYDTLNSTPMTSNPATLFVAENAYSCPAAAIMPLTYDWAGLNSAIDNMQARGSTNQTIGLVWGWQALTLGSPMNIGRDEYPENTKRYMILLSDGLNTQDRWYGNGSDHSTQVDTRMALACTHAKADGVVIYTIFLDLGGGSNSSVLESCATDSSKYFHLTATGQLITTFQLIAQQITYYRVVE